MVKQFKQVGIKLAAVALMGVPVTGVLMGALMANAIAPAAVASEPRDHDALAEFVADLELTDSQKAELQIVGQDTWAELTSLLSSEQRQAFQTTFRDSRDFRQAMGAMELSHSQRRELMGLWRDSRRAIATILTPEQQRLVQQRLMERFRR